MSEARTTQDHETIRRWAEQRGGKPSAVADAKSGKDPGILRLDFEPKDEDLEGVSWEAVFQKFDQAHLSFLYQEETEDGRLSRFHKFIRERH